MSQPVKVSLGGHEFTLRTDDSAEHVQACAALVNERLDDLQKKGAPASTIGLFVAMTLADDLLKGRATHQDTREALRGHLQVLRKAAV